MKTQHSSAFPIPFTLEEAQSDLRDVLRHFVLTTAFITNAEAAWRLLGVEIPGDGEATKIQDIDVDASELGLTDEILKGWHVWSAFEEMYRFAYLGEAPRPLLHMGPGSDFTWPAAFLLERQQHSRLSDELEMHGARVGNIDRCVEVMRLANARLLLEGAVPFLAELAVEEEYLTIKQVAMLAGMEEMTIRTAANPKRPNALPVVQVDGRTFVTPEDAREWLRLKGRYVEVTVAGLLVDMDLEARSFVNASKALEYVFVMLEERGFDEAQFTALCKPYIHDREFSHYYDLRFADLLVPGLLETIGTALDLPTPIFELRVREAVMKEGLALVADALRKRPTNTKP